MLFSFITTADFVPEYANLREEEVLEVSEVTEVRI
jgi:hypothetical protein